MRFNEGLLETVSVLLLLDVLVLHLFALKALFLPVELKVDVASDCRDREVLISQFHNLALDVLVLNTCQLRVELEVLSDDFIGQLSQRLDLVRGEGLSVGLLCALNSLRDVSIVKGLLLFLILSFSFGQFSRGGDFSSKTHFLFFLISNSLFNNQ